MGEGSEQVVLDTTVLSNFAGTDAVGTLGDHLDPGEAASLAYLLEHDGTLATDDLAARRAAGERGVPVTGSIGLLVRCVELGRIDRTTADGWLDTWCEVRGYYAPVGSVDELLDDGEQSPLVVATARAGSSGS